MFFLYIISVLKIQNMQAKTDDELISPALFCLRTAWTCWFTS